MEGTIPNPPNTRIAVVTGGNKGIGLEVCRQLAAAGITVVLTARDEKRGVAAVEKLREAGLSDVIFHQLEITDAPRSPSISRLTDFLKTRFGKLDILVNNAAIGGVEYVQDPVDSSLTSNEKFGGMDQLQRLEWMATAVRETYAAAREGLQTNYYGTKHVIEALLPLLQASSDGRIVNVSSEWGLLRLINNEELKQELNDNVEKLTEERLDEILDTFLNDFKAGEVEAHGWPKHFSAYKLSKVTLNAYSRILARRHPELRINCAHPGYVKTDMTLQSGLLTPEEGASNLVNVVLLPEGGPTGTFFALGQEAPFRKVMEEAIPDPANARIAVVTGGNKGIGLEVCRQLAGAGITVVLTARDEKRGAAAVEKLREAGLSDVIFHQLEITDAPSVARLADFLKIRFGKLDILVNNAAVIGAVEHVQDPADNSLTSKEKISGMDKRRRLEWFANAVRETYDAAREAVQINYYGTKHVIEALLPLLQASSDGRIVNVSSERGLLRLINNEELKQELNDDVEKLTEERLDEILGTFLNDFKAGELEAHGWPKHFSAYKVSKVTLNVVLFTSSPNLNFSTMQKEDSPSHQTCGTCMEY
nr:(-)-isopiperitenone reductase-like [Setaria viridis]